MASSDFEANVYECPLVIWVDTFRSRKDPKLKYSDLYDGVFLSDVMKQIDPRPAYQNVVRKVRDANMRHQNWDLLLKNIKAYYSDVLEQLLVQRLPNIACISREPEKESSFNEIKKMLLLILGCAVQCERKEEFITVIMDLEVSVQQEIVESIKQITEDSKFLLSTDCQDPDILFSHLVHLIQERDQYAESLADVVQERDFYQGRSEGSSLSVSPASTPEKQTLLAELNDCKARIRQLKQDLDDRVEQLSDIQYECDEHKTNLAKLRNENVDLLRDARSARALRDELDILREKVSKVNNLETEIMKYKEKLNELDFYKARVEELRDDNKILTECKLLMEQELSSSHKRVETVVQLEQQLMEYRQQIEEFSSERDMDSERIAHLVEENAQLQLEKKMNMNESSSLAHEIEATKAKVAGVGGAISDQLKETTNAKILRLELENQHLLRKLDDMKESALLEKTAMTFQLETENRRLLKKMEALKHDSIHTQQKCTELEDKVRSLLKEKEMVVIHLQSSKESFEREFKELERQNEDLTQTLQVLRTRNEQTNDTKMKDLEKENSRLHETLAAKNKELTKVEFSNRQLQKTQNVTQDSIGKISKLESINEALERKNLELQQKVNRLELTNEKFDKLEHDNSDLGVENQKLVKKLEYLQTAVHKKENVEQDLINVKVENQKLQKMVDTMKASINDVADLENTNSLLRKEIQQCQRIIDAKKSQDLKMEKLELDLLDLDNENMKLQKQLEITTNRVKQLEKDNTELEQENEHLEEVNTSLTFAQKRIVDLEKRNSDLENEFTKLQNENTQLSREFKRNKATLDRSQSAFNELQAKHSVLEISHKELQRNVDRDKGSSREFDKEHMELLKGLQLEKQTVNTLRTDLMNERNNNQELLNKMEQQTKRCRDLEQMVLGRGNNSSNDLAQLKGIESKMQETLNKTIAMRDDTIQALESRLEESKNRNLRLQEDLRSTKRECESLKQRLEEDTLAKEQERRERESSQNSSLKSSQQSKLGMPPNNTSHLVQLERQNERLLVESKNLKSVNENLSDQINKLEAHNSELQSQNNKVQSEKGALQVHNAHLQMENTSFHSQCEKLHSQVNTLQQDIARFHSESDSVKLQLRELNLEHESLISEHGSLKSIHKNLQSEHRELQHRLHSMVQPPPSNESQVHEIYNKLRSDHERLLTDYEKLKNSYEAVEKEKYDVVAENKRIKTEYNTVVKENSDLKTRHRDLESDLNMLVEKYNNMCEIYTKALEEKEQLMTQLDRLIEKNQELLNYVLNNKDQMAGQEKSYIEQLSDLRRQKERLEEKIMEHYKNREKQKKNKSFGAKLLQRMRGLTRSKSRPNLLDGSPDSTSIGSWSYMDHDAEKKAGARSIEDIMSCRSNADLTCSFSNSTSVLLPGLGKPVDDDDGGFGGGERGEFMTLQEFLAEGLDKSSPKQKMTDLKSEDTESRSSDNSEDHQQRRRRPAPLPPSMQQTRSKMSTIPDVAAVSQSDLSVSHLSRLSNEGNSGSNPDIRPDSAFTPQLTSPPYSTIIQPNTSTPARPHNLQARNSGFDDFNNSAFSRVGGHDMNDSYNSQFNNGQRENDIRLTPDARIDMLTRGNNNSAFSSPFNQGASNSLSPNYHSPHETVPRSHEEDTSIRSGPGASPNWQRGQGQTVGGQGPLKATQPHQNFTSGMSPQQQSDERSQPNYQQYPATRRSGNILVSRANGQPRQYGGQGQTNPVRQRPRSAFAPAGKNLALQNEQVFGSATNLTMNNTSAGNRSLPPDVNGGRMDLNNSGISSSLSSGQVQSSRPLRGKKQAPSYEPQNHFERPKSVPPTMFNAQPGSDSDEAPLINHTGNRHSNNMQAQVSYGKGTPPVPPPRKNKDVLTLGKYSVLREPSSPGNKGLMNNLQASTSRLQGQEASQPAQGLSEEKKREIWTATRL
ncbi:girdin-like isoform X2 [Dreissena polymorpha]|uniref:girdin-like isoform X2 n=1 Tax=Dreissena polymorpha TaxID=45954 RepID=UPI002263E31B|nr:girdin-like isoform X2 [Dreissena polymorpha]